MAGNWISIIWIIGSLILALSALRSHQINARKGVTWVLIWIAIFFVVAAFFNAID
ncbi:hypothetical protein GRI39_03850 [Altererythrobacter indicus]|uniref:Uncharacterized protein n=1 Tax=Altericroceibacterium indicum TaxID=374177 RepID=A0A845A6K0_9SPHN|nr:hypothetical protein [Altericroceibacterium indicum]MXP25177.1 hypothetical protein [Altericroceibacterium indicum]